MTDVCFPYLGTVKNPKPRLQLVRAQASVERVVRLLCLIASPQMGGGRILPSAERRVRLIAHIGLAQCEQHVFFILQIIVLRWILTIRINLGHQKHNVRMFTPRFDPDHYDIPYYNVDRKHTFAATLDNRFEDVALVVDALTALVGTTRWIQA